MPVQNYSISKVILFGFIIFLGIGIIYVSFSPFNMATNEIPDEAILEWEGEITDKGWMVEVDHEVYYLQINATVNKMIDFKGYWEKFSIGDYIYCFTFADVQIISDNKQTY